MTRGRLLEWLYGLGRSQRASRRHPRSRTPFSLRQPYLRLSRVEHLEERTLLNAVYVDDSATGLNNGASWANAYKSLQSALALTARPLEIRVAQGTYKPTTGTDRTASFVLKSGISLLGGYAGFGAPNPDARDVGLYVSVLSGDIAATGSTADNNYHVVVGSGANSSAVLDGFTITAGNANDSSSSLSSNGRGGGMYTSAGSPTLRNCTLTANSAIFCGGGMYNDSSSPALTSCTFIANYANNDGGGMYNDSASSPALVNCTLLANFAGRYGGAMSNPSSSPTMTNCTFIANSAYAGGGIDNDSSSPTLINCTLLTNAATVGGALCNSSSSPTITNCILWGNMAARGSQIFTGQGTPVVEYSDIQGGYAGTRNINSEPLFVRNPMPGADGMWGTADDDPGDLRLRPFSPGVDAGLNSAVPSGVTSDRSGNPRFGDVPTTVDTGAGPTPIVDMGAYEAVVDLEGEAGGPYAVLEGGALKLHGDGASARPGILLYEWDFDADGLYDDAIGKDPTFSAADLAGRQTRTVGLRVTDGASVSVTDTTVVVIASPIAYVDDTADGSNDGTSWSDAYTDLQAALAMSAPGQVIRTAHGTYKPASGTDRAASFVLRSGVQIRGGYAGYGAPDPDARDPSRYATTLSGDIGATGNSSDNSLHVVTSTLVDGTAILDGCTIRAGNANRKGFFGDDSGGGMYNGAGSPTLINCTFADNAASQGGGIYNYAASPTVRSCTFTANRADYYGGGIYNNSSSSRTLTNCTFNSNSAGRGGGMCNDFSSSVMVTNCTFTANSAGSGGGLDSSFSSSATLTNCAFTANSASHGGGVSSYSSSAPVTNCTFAANWAGYNGGGIYIANGSSPALTNCILWENMAPSGSQIYNDNSTPTVTYSDIQGGYTGACNINVDPQFVRSPSPGPDATWGTADDVGDLRLRLFSRAVDAGDSSAVPGGLATDLAGNVRFRDVPTTANTGAGPAPIVDMGAYEAVPALDAEAGGPYAVLQGGSVALHGDGASDQPGVLTYEWDFDADGRYDDAVGPTPTFSAASLRGPMLLTVGLRVTDGARASIVDTATVVVAAAIAYVDGAAAGLNDGTSWANAYTDLQLALAMSGPAQVIRVAQGTYKPTTGNDRTISFVLRSHVEIDGGYTGCTAADPAVRDPARYVSALSGDIGVAGSTGDNSCHVLIGSGADSTAILDGFTVTCGNANASGLYDSGGGMYNNAGGPTVRNCTFTANSAVRGGGMSNFSSSPKLTNCTFLGNSAGSDGGGMYDFSSSPTLSNCTFLGNSSGSDGGGMLNEASSSPTLINCTLTANSASDGAGMYNASSSPTLANCTFAANWARRGGAMYNSSSSPVLTNCILWGNTAPYDPQVRNDSSAPTVTYCDVQGGYGGTGNISADPQFVRNPDAGADGTWGTPDDGTDLRLRLTSPCIDAGSNAGVPPGVMTDLAGKPRKADIPAKTDSGSGTAPLVDMGAYEAVPAVQALTGGPFGVLMGNSIALSGAGYSQRGLGASYSWDLNGDGLFDDATGPSPVFSAVGIQTPQTLSIALRVTDTSGASATAGTVLRVLGLVYVDDSASGLNDGTSWINAYTSLQSALAAAVAGQVICVGQGTYKPTAGADQTASFRLGSSVSIYGGYAGHGAADPLARDPARYVTLLSGDIGAPGDTSDNSYHVVVTCSLDSTAVLDGCAIAAGNASGSSFPDYHGGGMLNISASPTVRNCTFAANAADANGGGMCNYNLSSPVLTNCTFSGNSATSSGGAMCNYNLSCPTLTNCTFSGNSARDSGGGMALFHSSSPTLSNCILWANTAASGSQIYSSSSFPVVAYCDVQAGYSGARNVDGDPQFVRNPSPGADGKWGTADDDYGDLRLRPTSPCIDAGNNAAVPSGVTTDLAGNPRFADVPARPNTGSGTPPIVDMGAYESPNPALTVAGTDGSDDFALSLTDDLASLQITGPAGSYTYPVACITSVQFTAGAGDDRLIVNFANGNPVPSYAMVYDGGPGTDTIRISASGSDATLTATQITVGAGPPITLTNVEGTSFDLGTGRLTKSGGGVALLSGASSYTGGTEVTGGTLQVASADALPAGRSLTIAAGATVVLSSGLSAALVVQAHGLPDQAPRGGEAILLSPVRHEECIFGVRPLMAAFVGWQMSPSPQAATATPSARCECLTPESMSTESSSNPATTTSIAWYPGRTPESSQTALIRALGQLTLPDRDSKRGFSRHRFVDEALARYW